MLHPFRRSCSRLYFLSISFRLIPNFWTKASSFLQKYQQNFQKYHINCNFQKMQIFHKTLRTEKFSYSRTYTNFGWLHSYLNLHYAFRFKGVEKYIERLKNSKLVVTVVTRTDVLYCINNTYGAIS